ncbi:hypothetical protein [Comamonas flocculans]|uniref:hypothetical protein n=1 Tax=Comamonas flocculans TaxID=2597701 RepID=UPI0016493504|nr:hypothetical protein [Comamonas flocculans]
MNRCRRLLAPAALALLLAGPGLPAQAQQQPLAPSGGAARNFPDAALRGSVTFESAQRVLLNGQPLRSAPGLRVFDTHNRLVMAHTLRGKTFTVHYVIERSTGMLHTVWLLSEAEAARPRAAPGMQLRNFRFESELPDGGIQRH